MKRWILLRQKATLSLREKCFHFSRRSFLLFLVSRWVWQLPIPTPGKKEKPQGREGGKNYTKQAFNHKSNYKR